MSAHNTETVTCLKLRPDLAEAGGPASYGRDGGSLSERLLVGGRERKQFEIRGRRCDRHQKPR
jgi:hypothetical protein